MLIDEEGWARELPFLILAALLHAGVLSSLPGYRPRELRPGAAVAVDFVAELPKPPAPPSPELAPAAPAPKPQPKPEPTPQPAKRKAPRRALSPEQIQARREAAERRREQARLRAEALAAARAEKLEAQRREREARLEAQRLAREAALRAKQEAAAAAARQRAALKSALAQIKDPDEKLADVPADPDSLASGKAAIAAGPTLAPAAAGPGDPLYDVQRDGYDPPGGKLKGGGAGTAWSIAGPAGNRRLLRQRLPRAPQWVSERGLELSVTIRFEVLPDGGVRAGAVTRKTSGFPEVDRAAVEAVRSWRFERLAPGTKTEPVWGDVTFRFLMG